jgi:hypothetical protein
MAQFDYVLTAADIGRVLDPPDGFVVKLIRTKPPVDDGPPRASPDGTWLSGRLQLRGVREFRDLYCGDSMCLEPSTRPTLIANSSYPYRGGLVVKALQKGAEYEITLSDSPYVREARDFAADLRRIEAMRKAATQPV